MKTYTLREPLKAARLLTLEERKDEYGDAFLAATLEGHADPYVIPADEAGWRIVWLCSDEGRADNVIPGYLIEYSDGEIDWMDSKPFEKYLCETTEETL